MPSTVSLVLNQIAASLAILRHRNARICAALMLAMSWIGIATAPVTTRGFTAWAGLLLIALLSILAVMAHVGSSLPELPSEDRHARRIAALTLVAIALFLATLFSIPSALLLAFGLILSTRQTARMRPGMFPWMLSAILVTLVPWWTWSALGAWRPALLVLLPLAALGWLSTGHILEAYRLRDGDARSPLSMRGHRLGAWMAMLLGGIVIVIAGLVFDASNAWVALGGILMAVAVALEAGISRPEDNPGKHAAAICDGAFLAAAICWLIGVT